MSQLPPKGQGERRTRLARGRAFASGVVAITLLAGLLRAVSLDTGLPHWGTRPDELPVIQHTALPAQGELNLHWSVYPPAYVYASWLWGELGIRAAQLLGLLPPGSYVQTLRHHRAAVFLVQRSFSLVAGTAAVLALMLLARRRLGAALALCAGALLATSFLHVRDSHGVKPDVWLSLWVVLALFAMWPLARRATTGRGVLAGAAVGMAMGAKYPAVLLLAPLLLAAFLGSQGSGWRRWLPAPALVGGLVAAAVFLATSPSLLVDDSSVGFLADVLEIVFPQRWIRTLLPAGVTGHTGIARIRLPGPGWSSLIYHLRYSLVYGAGLLAALAAAPAVLWGFAQGRRIFPLAALTLVTWIAVFSFSPHRYARYLTPVLPLLALLEAGGLHALAARLAPHRTGWVLIGGTLLLAAQPLHDSIAFDRLAGRTDTRVLATRWMKAHLPRRSTVAIMGTQFWAWGQPELPPGMVGVGLPRKGDPLHALRASHARYLLAHHHDRVFSSTVDPQQMAVLAPHLRLLAEFDPGGPGEAWFEPMDAYYIPLHGLCELDRPGPKIELYAVRKE